MTAAKSLHSPVSPANPPRGFNSLSYRKKFIISVTVMCSHYHNINNFTNPTMQRKSLHVVPSARDLITLVILSFLIMM